MGIKISDKKNTTEFESMDLAGVIVGDTAISDVDGETGSLTYRGIDISDLVDYPFMDAVGLLLFGESYLTKELHSQYEQELSEFMMEQRRLSVAELKIIQALPENLHPMLVLQGLVPMLSIAPQQRSKSSLLANTDIQQGLAIAAKLPSIIAARHRIVKGESIVPSSDSLNFHENFLLMFHGKAPTKEQVNILDVTQILQMEHSFNAGTFAGRVCASTKAPIQSSISASIGTLFGILHGGADQAALEMAMKIGSPEKATAYVEHCLLNKIKIMGMGHREYKVVDPRAAILKPMAVTLCEEGEAKRLLQVLMSVEEACHQAFKKQGKEIWANVEFYKGAVFHSLGVDTDFFTSLFAMARVYGYIAHFVEFQKESRLIRPRARYVGS